MLSNVASKTYHTLPISQGKIFQLLKNILIKTPTQSETESVCKYSENAPATKDRRLFYLDTYKLIERLQSQGFSQQQSEAICDSLVDVIHGHIEHQNSVMVTKSQQEITYQQVMSNIAAVKKDMLILEKSEFSALRHETEKQTMEIKRIDHTIQEAITKLRAEITLDINLEKSRSKESSSVNENHLSQLRGQIDTQIANLRTTFEQYRYDVLKFAAGTVLSCLTICLGFYRLWSS